METNDIKLAKAIDDINEYLIKYYLREIETGDGIWEIQGHLYKKNKDLDSTFFEVVTRIMNAEGYLGEEAEDDIVKTLHYTSKGLHLYFNGGLIKSIKRQRSKDLLYRLGQVAVILAGLYYAIEILKNYFHFIYRIL